MVGTSSRSLQRRRDDRCRTQFMFVNLSGTSEVDGSGKCIGAGCKTRLSLKHAPSIRPGLFFSRKY